ncbi:MAG: AraC family transcriptional regulator [Clostridiales bacterium]|nr:AraC family transcriptional regulator [Clostridiales bacterium]
MNLLEGMNKAIDYIEENLGTKIDYDKLSRIAGCSQWYLQRMFMSITDVSISEYIRRRRLTLAAFELQNTDISVLDLALKYGYKSVDAFTRAFKAIHSVTPSKARKNGVVLKSYGPITFVLSIKGVKAMNYSIEKKGKMKIVGVKKWFSAVNGEQTKEIPKMWDEFPKEKMDFIKSFNKDNEIVGVCADMYNDGFDYWVGAITDKECPEELCEMEIPESTWAVFEVIGPIRPLPNTMQDLFGRIFSEWFPNSGYKHAEIPEIEYYSNGDCMSENYKSEIWIPVEKL